MDMAIRAEVVITICDEMQAKLFSAKITEMYNKLLTNAIRVTHVVAYNDDFVVNYLTIFTDCINTLKATSPILKRY